MAVVGLQPSGFLFGMTDLADCIAGIATFGPIFFCPARSLSVVFDQLALILRVPGIQAPGIGDGFIEGDDFVRLNRPGICQVANQFQQSKSLAAGAGFKGDGVVMMFRVCDLLIRAAKQQNIHQPWRQVLNGPHVARNTKDSQDRLALEFPKAIFKPADVSVHRLLGEWLALMW